MKILVDDEVFHARASSGRYYMSTASPEGAPLTTSIADIVSKVERENLIFANKRALDALSLPTKILGREEQMIKSGLLHSKQTKYGLEVSLEFTQKDKLIDIMKRVFHDDEYV